MTFQVDETYGEAIAELIVTARRAWASRPFRQAGNGPGSQTRVSDGIPNEVVGVVSGPCAEKHTATLKFSQREYQDLVLGPQLVCSRCAPYPRFPPVS